MAFFSFFLSLIVPTSFYLQSWKSKLWHLTYLLMSASLMCSLKRCSMQHTEPHFTRAKHTITSLSVTERGAPLKWATNCQAPAHPHNREKLRNLAVIFLVLIFGLSLGKGIWWDNVETVAWNPTSPLGRNSEMLMHFWHLHPLAIHGGMLHLAGLSLTTHNQGCFQLSAAVIWTSAC